MVAAMGAFALEDVLVKAASKSLPVGQILLLFGLGGATVFGCVALLSQQKLISADVVSRPMQLRMLFEIFGRLFYVLAIALTPLSAATVILQATPMVVVAGAAVIFGEKVGYRRWLAMVIGMAGVVVIVRPGAESFSLLSLLAVLGMLGFAGRDLASRAAPRSLGISVLGFFGFLSVIAAGILCSIWNNSQFVWPNWESSLSLAGAVILGVAAYAGLMKAMRTGEVSVVTPFRYSRLVFGMALGTLLFNEQLALPVLTGCGLIVFSGVLNIWNSRRSMTTID